MDGADATGRVGDPGVPGVHAPVRRAPRRARVGEGLERARATCCATSRSCPSRSRPSTRRPDDLPPESSPTSRSGSTKRAYRPRGKVPARLAYGHALGRLRDVTVAGVQVPGAQYDRRTRSLRVFTSMDVTVTVQGRRALAADRERTAFESRSSGSTDRRWRTTRRQRSPEVRKAGGTDEDAQEFLPACGEEYLIVTSPALRPAADTLAAAKQAAGLRDGIHEVAPGTPPPTCARSSAAS